MPIPIPVPMPVSGGSGKFAQQNHGHQREYENSGNEHGEVKKIYLLQPIAKTNHYSNSQQSQQPVQVPFQQQQQQQHQFQQQPQQQQQTQNIEQLSHSAAKGVTDMKILPIVVIPPIAPMPPIQLHQPSSASNQILHVPRMTLSPQFNNYMVSSGSGEERMMELPHHSNQQQQSFIEYGGSGGGHMYRRERPRLRNRSLMSSQSGRSIGFEYNPRARVRIHEEILSSNNDYNDYNPNSYRSMVSRTFHQPMARYSQMPTAQRRRWRSDHFADSSSTSGRQRAPANSIRDIMEAQQQQQFELQQSIFDDEPNNGITDETVVNKRKAYEPDLINSEQRQQQQQHQLSRDSSDKDYLDSFGKDSSSSGNNLNSNYYDRDYQTASNEMFQQPKLNIKYQSSSEPGSSRRLYLDDKEVLNDEDEWRFDSIKSISHASPIANSTTTAANQTVTPPIQEPAALGSNLAGKLKAEQR